MFFGLKQSSDVSLGCKYLLECNNKDTGAMFTDVI